MIRLKEKINYKKILFLFMAIIIIFGIYSIKNPYMVEAAPIEERHFTYFVDSDKATITDYTGNLEGIYDVVIPNTLGGFPVVKIDYFAMENKQLTSVIIPDSVLRIEPYAFYNNKLTEIIIPDSIIYLGDGAFSDNLLTSVIISVNTTEIGAFIFYNNELTDVVIPSSVTNIGDYAFSNNLLTNIEISKNVTNIGNNAFSINKLTNVKFLSSSATLGTNIFSSNQVTPSNLVIEGYTSSTIESHASLKGFTFITLPGPNGNTIMKTSVLPGVMAISSFPSNLSFESYEIGLNNPNLKLQMPFKLTIDDFTGSYAGWNLSITLTELVDGVDKLKNPSLTTNLTNLVINDANDTGLEAGSNISPPGTFTKTDGVVSFGTAKKILSAQSNNSNAAARHYLNFSKDALQISFDNSTKNGTFTGTTTFTLIATP